MNLRKFNNGLSVIVILLGLYIAFKPFIPQFEYWLKDKSPESKAPYSGQLALENGSKTTKPIPQDNRLVMPDIGINQPIYEGGSLNVIAQGGTWRRPNSSTPKDRGNTVIVGHRYFGNNISTFYNLDKVLPHQKIAIYWEGIEVLYEVKEVKVVESSNIEIESQSADSRLTIYTCHPLWTAKQRLVIVAFPIQPLDEEL